MNFKNQINKTIVGIGIQGVSNVLPIQSVNENEKKNNIPIYILIKKTLKFSKGSF